MTDPSSNHPTLSPALARCDQEITEMAKQTEAPAWLVALGTNDWEAEKELIAGHCSKALAQLLTRRPEDVSDAELEFALRLARPGCNARSVESPANRGDAATTSQNGAL